jgi:hypothetical protein
MSDSREARLLMKHGQSLATLHSDLGKLITHVRKARDTFEQDEPQWANLNSAWVEACAALGGVTSMMGEIKVLNGAGPMLAPPDPEDGPDEMHVYHHERKRRLTGAMAAANDHSLER